MRLPEGQDGSLIVYAAAAGSEASDGQGAANSPFAAALAQRLVDPQVEVAKLGYFVADDVRRVTNNQQQPQQYGSIPPTPVFFVADGPQARALSTRTDPPPSSQPAPQQPPATPRGRDYRVEIAQARGLRAVFDIPGDSCRSDDTYYTKQANLLGEGGSYTVTFERLGAGRFRWTATGPHQTGCQQYASTVDSTDDPTQGRFTIWGRTFAFDADGRIWDPNNNSDVHDTGFGTPMGSPERTIGQITRVER